jgi:hypothetical protein
MSTTGMPSVMQMTSCSWRRPIREWRRGAERRNEDARGVRAGRLTASAIVSKTGMVTFCRPRLNFAAAIRGDARDDGRAVRAALAREMSLRTP